MLIKNAIVLLEEIDRLIELVWKTLDEGMADAKAAGCFRAA